MAEENVSGIAVGLSLDTSGFSSGIARAKTELQSLQESARNISIGVSVAAPGRPGGRGGLQEPGVAVALPGVQPRVSPRFNVSAGAVRDLRTDINAQMRTFASQGEGVAVGIKLGRVPYARLRSEIETGIGTVTIRSLAIAPSAITAAARQLANPAVAVNVAAAGVPKRAAGGSVSPPNTYVVGERRAELFRPTVPGRIEQLPHAWKGRAVSAAPYTRNLREAARELSPQHISFGKAWYPNAGGWVGQQAAQYGLDERTARGIVAALSAGTAWNSNKTKATRIFAAHAAGKPFPYGMGLDAHRKALKILEGANPESILGHTPKVGQFYRNLGGDLDALTLDRWAFRTATRGRVSQLHGGPKRDAIERAYRGVASEFGLHPVELQASVWALEKERASARQGGGRDIARYMAGGGKVDAFGHPYRGSFSKHYGTKTHQSAMYPSYGRKMRGKTRPSWMVGEGQEPWEYDDEGNRVPMARGGRARLARDFALKPIASTMAAGGSGFDPVFGAREGDAQGWDAIIRKHRLVSPYEADKLHGWAPQEVGAGGIHTAIPWMQDEKTVQDVARSMTLSQWPKQRMMWRGGAVFRPAKPEAFHSAIGKARGVTRPSGRSVGETVHQYELDEYRGMRTFLNTDGTAGYAVKPDGDLVSIFNVGGPGGGKSALRSAIHRGATKLDAFDEVSPTFALGKTDPRDTQKNLPNFYKRFGFREVGRDPWDPQYAPEGWQGGTPDVVYMQRGKRAAGGRALGPIGRRLAARSSNAKQSLGGRPVDPTVCIRAMMTRDCTQGHWYDSAGAPHHFGEGVSPSLQVIRGGGPAPLVLDTSGRMVDAPIGPGSADVPYDLPWQASKKQLRARPTKLPKGVKVRFSTEWTDYPDPSKFLTTSGGFMGTERRTASGFTHDRYSDPGQLRMELSGTGHGDPMLTARGESDQPKTRFRGIGDWLQRGRPIKSDDNNPFLVAYALDEKNRVLGHARFSAGVATPLRGKDFGKIASTLHPDYVWVNPELQGKGVASAMYAKTERFTGVPISPASSQTPHGRGLWSKPPNERAFGRMFGQRDFKPGDRDRINLDRGEYRVGVRNNVYGRGWVSGGEDVVEEAINFAGAVDPVTEMRKQRQRRIKGQLRLPGFRAAGGRAGGTYVVSELGKELFVPTSKEHLIPPNVAKQIPGGGSLAERIAARQPQTAPEPWKPAWLRRGSAKDLTGRAGGGMVEIGGHGPMVWQAPEDGWIIPNHLMNKVPRAQAGSAPGETPQERRARIARENAERRRTINEARSVTYGAISSRPGPGAFLDYKDIDTAVSEARIAAATQTRGLSARQNLAGQVAGFFGGERRKRALAEGTFYESKYLAQAPRGTPQGIDTMHAIAERLLEVKQSGEVLQQSLDDFVPKYKKNGDITKASAKQLDVYTKAIEDNRGAQKQLTEDYVTAEETKGKATKALQQASGGALAQIASLTAAGFVFSAASQAVSGAADVAAKALSPVIDGLTGFSGANTRVSKGLADLLPQVGNLGTLFGQTGVQAGLSGGNTEFLQRQLGGGVLAKAGAAKAGQADDLFRAALGTGAPQGLLGGYGGLFGSALFGEQLGGGKGLLEQIGKTAQETTTPGLQGPDPVGAALGSWLRGMAGKGSIAEQVLGPEPAQTPKQEAVQKETIDYVNDAISRGRTSLGLGTGGPRLTDIGKGDARAQAIADNEALNSQVRDLARAGEVFMDAAGNITTDTGDIVKLTEQLASGLAIPDKAAFAKANAQQLQAGIQTGQAQGEFERGTAIPGAIGQQILANPFQSAATGLEKGFQPTIANLTEINSLQKDLTNEAHKAVEAQAKFIDTNVGQSGGAQFRQDMQQVEAYGQQIADINGAIMDRQAALGAKQYAYNLHIINRNIADARGLAGQRGGSRLGVIERRQYELGRESTGLGLQSTGLSLQMNQREINFSKALAGFQAVGISGEERAARMAEAEAQAKYQQQQQNIAVQQFGISKQQFGLEGQAFGIQTGRQVTDLEGQKAILQQSHALEQEQLAAQKQIVAISMKQSKIQQDATSLFSQATGNFNNRLAVSAQYVAMYSGTIAAADAYIKKALGLVEEKPSDRHGHASGIVGLTLGPTSAMYGEAGTEGVVIAKNPRMGALPSGFGMGGGGGTTVNVYISGNSIREDKDIDMLTRRVTDEVVEAIGRKAGMLSLAS